ncbi:HAD-IA family hydrolase [Frankia sp. Cr2]|uniref:HAD-IA family hydrolase n=1 Tax=Frankia sp. Cr2 TaxID=3073932 RepID=UPI002AD1FF5A|nr:HAD-IA family hydrolase [Frankia sp. Cr2]
MTELAGLPIRVGRSFDAVVVDFGGVLVTPVVHAIAAVAARHGVEPGVLRDVILGPSEVSSGHPWHRAERGEIACADLPAMLAPIAAAAGIAVEGDELDLILDARVTAVDAVVGRIGALRAADYRTALLINSFKELRARLEAMVDFGLFDVVVDSCEVGLRKPDAAIYELVAERLGASPDRIRYLDHLAHNLRPAAAAGWSVVHVADADTAVRQLDRLLESPPALTTKALAEAEQKVAALSGPYQRLLDEDTHEVPAVLRLQHNSCLDTEDIPVRRYTSRAYHEREKERLWSRVWQFACREEHLPEPGDVVVYDIAGRSYLLVRQADGTIRGYVNACLHRGRRLRDYDGHCDGLLRCPFHGFAWRLDGNLADVPAGWDFPQLPDRDLTLPQVRVDSWAGFVFINPDPGAGPLAEFLGGIIAHFAGWDLGSAYVEVHVAKVIQANWKIAQEAFCEAYHVAGTHPQILPWQGDLLTQVDVWDNFARAITPGGVTSPHLTWVPSEEEMLRSMLDVRDGEASPITLRPGERMRAVAAELARTRWRPLAGDQVDRMSDAEMMDSIDYTVFPNFHPWGAFNRIVYRFRPNGDDHRSCIMEVLLLSPFRGQRPRPSPVRWLAADEPWSAEPRLSSLGKVFDQDTFNMANVQLGLETTLRSGVLLSEYQESKVRWLHRTLTEWIGE